MNPLPILKSKEYRLGVPACLGALAAVILATTCVSPPAEVAHPITPDPTVEASPAPEIPAVPDTAAILALAAEYLSGGNFDGALALFDTIAKPDADSSGIRLLKASILSSAGRYAEARLIAEHIVAIEPENSEPLFILASLEGAEGRELEQRALLTKITTMSGDQARAYTTLGNLSLAHQSLREAAAYFDQALNADENAGDALLGRASVYRLQNKPNEAQTLLNKAISLYPQWADPLSERARLYHDQGFPGAALIDLDAARALSPNDYWISYERGTVLIALRRKQEALAEFERTVNLNPGYYLAYVYSAGLKDEFGDYEGAEHDYTTLAALKPDYYFAFEGIGVHKMRQGLYAEARDAFLVAYNHAQDETTYAFLAAICWLHVAANRSEVKTFLDEAMGRVQRESMTWYMFRLLRDYTGDTDVNRRIEVEQDASIKARMTFYLACYYDLRNNTRLANAYYEQMDSLGRQGTQEWRLNDWILKARGLKL
jgi:tetratricopeptide (TPR) repeat protein